MLLFSQGKPLLCLLARQGTQNRHEENRTIAPSSCESAEWWQWDHSAHHKGPERHAGGGFRAGAAHILKFCCHGMSPHCSLALPRLYLLLVQEDNSSHIFRHTSIHIKPSPNSGPFLSLLLLMWFL